MKESIFDNQFKLNFSSKCYRVEYEDLKYEEIKKYIKFLTICLFLVSLALTLINLLTLDEMSSTQVLFLIIDSCLACLILFIFFLIVLCSEKRKTLIFITRANFFLLTMIFANIRFVASLLNSQSFYIVFQIIVSAEFFFRLVWIMLKIQGFYETFCINIINLVILWIVYPTVFSRKPSDNTNYYSLLVYSFFIMMTVLCSYFFDRKQKEYFFLNLLDKKKAKWLTSVFDNMNNGFLSFKGNSIMYCNSFLFQKLFKSKLQNSVRSNNKLVSRNYGECNNIYIFFLIN
jgi:hypothetical protein